MLKDLVWINIVFFLSSILLSLVINSLFLKFSMSLGIRNQGDTVIRWSSRSKPSLGGISFFIIFLLSIIGFAFIFKNFELFNLQVSGIIAISTIGFLMGLFDDAYNTKPLIKFLTQFLCGVILILTGTTINLFNIPFIDYPLTVLWIVGMMNSINMLDNMDAITSTVSSFIIMFLILVLFNTNNVISPLFFMLLGVLGSLLGFLYYNWNPSKIYMGDTGSQFLGAFLGGISIILLWNHDKSGTYLGSSKNIILVLLAFAIPIIDTVTVSIKRIRRGKSPFVGGKDHTTHHLSYIGFSDRMVAVTFIIISLITLILNYIVLTFISNWNWMFASIFAIYFFVVFSILFYIANLNLNKN